MASVIEIVQSEEPPGATWDQDSRINLRIQLATQKLSPNVYGPLFNERVAMQVLHVYASEATNIDGYANGVSITFDNRTYTSVAGANPYDLSTTKWGQRALDIDKQCIIAIII